MTLTNEEIGALAVTTTLIGIFATVAIERGRKVRSDQVRWFKDAERAYAAFLNSSLQMSDIVDRVVDFYLGNTKHDITDEEISDYDRWRDDGHKAYNELWLVGSRESIELATKLMTAQNGLCGLNEKFSVQKPQTPTKEEVEKLVEELWLTRSKFINAARSDLHVPSGGTEAVDKNIQDELLIISLEQWLKKCVMKIWEDFKRPW